MLNNIFLYLYKYTCTCTMSQTMRYTKHFKGTYTKFPWNTAMEYSHGIQPCVFKLQCVGRFSVSRSLGEAGDKNMEFDNSVAPKWANNYVGLCPFILPPFVTVPCYSGHCGIMHCRFLSSPMPRPQFTLHHLPKCTVHIRKFPISQCPENLDNGLGGIRVWMQVSGVDVGDVLNDNLPVIWVQTSPVDVIIRPIWCLLPRKLSLARRQRCVLVVAFYGAFIQKDAFLWYSDIRGVISESR